MNRYLKCQRNEISKLAGFILIIFLSSNIFGQTEQLRFENITSSENGLSENVINCIYQDSRGFLWFGTDDGLNLYDGYRFTVFKPDSDNPNSINSNLIFAITEDDFGRIWVGTTGSGLNCYNPNTESFHAFRSEPNNNQTISHDHIVQLTKDHKGRIWVGTFNGATILEPHQEVNKTKLTRIEVPEAQYPVTIYSIVEDQSQILWFGARDGLYRAVGNGRPEAFQIVKEALNEIQSFGVRALAVDNSNKLIIATNQGLFRRMDWGRDNQYEKISSLRNLQSLIVEKNDKIWSGGYFGLSSFNKDNASVTTFTANPSSPNSLNNNVIRCLYKDQTGIIWIGTNGGGINRFDPSQKKFYTYGTDFQNKERGYKKVRSIYEDRYNNIWVGTEGGGLFKQSCTDQFCGDYTNFTHYGRAANIFALEEIKLGDEYVLFAGGQDLPFLQQINLSSDKRSTAVNLNFNGSVFSILQDNLEQIWLGTYNSGLARWILDKEGALIKDRFYAEDGLGSNIIRTIYEDTGGNIWIGTSNGLCLIDANQKQSEVPNIYCYQNDPLDTNSLSHNYILDIHESSTQDIWIATFGGGLNRLTHINDQIVFQRFTDKDGLPNNTIKCIEEDYLGNLWLATNLGLSQFNPRTNEFQNYSTSDGLQANEFLEGASFKRKNGNLLFGGVNGFNEFHPSEIEIRSTPPRLVFTKLSVYNQEVKPLQEVNGKVVLEKSISQTNDIQLKYTQNDFSVEFAALHYAAPEKNKYAYKLEGYHDSWINTDSDKRFATFTNLPHGKYELKVKASNGDGVWMNDPKILSIAIQPPFWLTWYAYLLYAALVFLALWLFRRYTLISIQEKHQLVLEHLERDKLEELNQMKLRFFTNISHELRTPLTLIIAPLEHILEKRKLISADKLQQHYHHMYKNAKYLLRLVNQLLDFRKLDQGSQHLRVGRGNIVHFIKETTEPFQFLANKKNIFFDIKYFDSNIYTFFDPNVIEKVIYNLLSNAFKFTPSGGKITVEISETDGSKKSIAESSVVISVSDTGPGIPKKKIKKIFERFYKERSKKQNKDGAGIGLAYTKSLVELHHGNISVQSEKDKGANFIVSLPQDKRAYLKSEIDQFHADRYEITSDPLEYLVEEPINESNTEGISLPSMQHEEGHLPLLLFVDDNPDIRRFIKEGFKNDFRIIDAMDGEKGYELALSSLPDIIVSDVIMPNMDGIDLCKSLKTNSLTSHIPVVLLTAKSASDDKIEGLSTGADAYVVKPFKLDVLRAQLTNIYLQREKLRENFRKEVILEPEEVTVTSVDEQFLARAMSIIEDHMADSEFNVEALVKQMHISRSKLYLKLKALTGLSSSEFIRTVRLKRAVQLLEKSDYTIKEIMFMTGFNTASYFSKCFKKQFGVVPSEYLRNKANEESEVPIYQS